MLRFGLFEADIDNCELRKQGLKIRLQEQPFQLLSILLERSGQLVTREELRERLWGADTFVDFAKGLTKAVNGFRKHWKTPLKIAALSKQSPSMVTASSRRWNQAGTVETAALMAEKSNPRSKDRSRSIQKRLSRAVAHLQIIDFIGADERT